MTTALTVNVTVTWIVTERVNAKAARKHAKAKPKISSKQEHSNEFLY